MSAPSTRAVRVDGAIVLPFNSEGMYRACMGVEGVVHSAIYR